MKCIQLIWIIYLSKKVIKENKIFLVQSILNEGYLNDTNKKNLLTAFIKLINQQYTNRSQEERRSK